MSVLDRLPSAIHRLSGCAAILAAWLGGSYALGTATRLSDVDIAVLVGSAAPGRGGVFTDMDQDEGLDAVDEAMRRLFAPVRCSLIRLYPAGSVDPRTPRLLARAIPLVRRDGAAVDAYWQRLYSAGVPGPEEVERVTWQSRAAFACRMARWAQMDLEDAQEPGPCLFPRILAQRMAVRHVVLGAGASANLGHQVIKLLGLDVPDSRYRIPSSLCAAGLVSKYTAGYMQDVLGLRSRNSNQWREGGLREGNCEAILRGAWRLQDWAWSCCRALEQAAALQKIQWRRPPTLAELLNSAFSGR